MPTRYHLNLNYVCNEHCVFCASDLTNNFAVVGRQPWLLVEEVRDWLGGSRPTALDSVILAGGEPTLHAQLVPIVRLLAAGHPEIRIFTNGLRLAEPTFAHALVEAGITRFGIALFGATAEGHDAVTGVPGSLERTLVGLQNLAALRDRYSFLIELRLLVSRQCHAENPEIVRLVHRRVRAVDVFSINPLILSEHARSASAAVSWAEARGSVNESARRVRQLGYELVFAGVPLCVFDEENAESVRRSMEPILTDESVEPIAGPWESRYLEPLRSRGPKYETNHAPCSAELAPCATCDYRRACVRVNSWYIEAFGTAGLQTVRRPARSGQPQASPQATGPDRPERKEAARSPGRSPADPDPHGTQAGPVGGGPGESSERVHAKAIGHL